MIRQQKCFKEKWNNVWCGNQRCIYSAAIYDADGSSLWHSEKLPDRNKAEVKQEAWFQNAQKNIETIHYGEKKLVQPDKARYVYEISRYIEYVENGNMKSGVLLLEYYTDSIDEVLLHYKSPKIGILLPSGYKPAITVSSI